MKSRLPISALTVTLGTAALVGFTAVQAGATAPMADTPGAGATGLTPITPMVGQLGISGATSTAVGDVDRDGILTGRGVLSRRRLIGGKRVASDGPGTAARLRQRHSVAGHTGDVTVRALPGSAERRAGRPAGAAGASVDASDKAMVPAPYARANPSGPERLPASQPMTNRPPVEPASVQPGLLDRLYRMASFS